MKKIIFIMLLLAVSVFAQQNMSGNITQPVQGSFTLAGSRECIEQDRQLLFGPTDFTGNFNANRCIRSDFFEVNGILSCHDGFCNVTTTLYDEIDSIKLHTGKEVGLATYAFDSLNESTDCLVNVYNGSIVNTSSPDDPVTVGSKLYFNTVKPCFVRTIAALGMLEQVFIDEENASFIVQKLQEIEVDYQHYLTREDLSASSSFNISKATLTGTVTGGGVQPAVGAQEARDVILTLISSTNDSTNFSTFNFATDSKNNASNDLVGYLVFVNLVGDPAQMQGATVGVPNNCNEERTNVFTDSQTSLEFYQSVVTCQNGYPGGAFTITVNGGDYLPYLLVSVVPDYSPPEDTESINGEIAISISEQTAAGVPTSLTPGEIFTRVDAIVGSPSIFTPYVKDEREANIFFGDFNVNFAEGIFNLSVNNERGPICTELLALVPAMITPMISYSGPMIPPVPPFFPLLSAQSVMINGNFVVLFGGVLNAGDPDTTPLALRTLYAAPPGAPGMPETAVILGSACSAADSVPGNNEVTVSDAFTSGGAGFTLGSTPTGAALLDLKGGSSGLYVLGIAAFLVTAIFLFILTKKQQ